MPSYINPNAVTNAFNLQVQMGQQRRAADQAESMNAQALDRTKRLNALRANPAATPEDYIRAGDPVTGNALAQMDERRQQAMIEAFPRIGALTSQVLTITDPMQRRAAFRSVIQQNGQLFDMLGMPHTDALAKLDTTDDATLEKTLTALAAHAPQAAPTDVAPGHSLVRRGGDGTYSAAYTAPSTPSGEGDAGFTLSPGQERFDKNGRRIAGVAAPVPGINAEQAKVASQLRDDFARDSKTFQGVADSYQRIVDSAQDPSAAGDLSLIFNYMKVLDPGSTVREGEFATAQNAGGIDTRVVSLYNKLMNGERLAPSQRTDFVDRATRLYRGQESRFKTQVLDRYKGLAARYGVNPDEFSDPRARVPTSALPQQNAQGWTLHEDARGNRAYVSPDGKQFQEVQ